MSKKTWIIVALVVLLAIGGVFYVIGSGDEPNSNGNQEPTGSGDSNEFEESYDPEMVDNLALSKDFDREIYEPINVTRDFKTDDAVYLTGVLQNPEVGMEVYLNLYDDEEKLVYAFDEEDYLVLEEMHISGGTTDIALWIGPQVVDWKQGTYWIELIADGETAATLKFEME